MLGALASMYWQAPMTVQVKNGGILGLTSESGDSPFSSTCGAKQGNPSFLGF